ncbi:MAG TPA: NADH:ubiquinone reductase (Na(+)-transporting) subunit C [Alloprevotella sp.]|nr:NADH:ubiquinone reductase (Na(+)-transporting) subunit C [Alloprevotella sp.]
MKLNTNSNTYTVIYASVVVVIVAFLLAFISSALKAPSEANERIDKKKQILASLNIRNLDNSQVEKTYAEVIKADLIVNDKGGIVSEGQEKDQAGFTVNRKDMNNENLPVFVCQVDSQTKYVLPLVGKGLWGTIWGYLALNADGKTVYGAYFSHESETAGLGALITEEKFQKEFEGKTVTDNEGNLVIDVVKFGQVKDNNTQCDGISGATLTTNGVRDMVREYLGKYQAFLNANK